jgi:hypothetical protein
VVEGEKKFKTRMSPPAPAPEEEAHGTKRKLEDTETLESGLSKKAKGDEVLVIEDDTIVL